MKGFWAGAFAVTLLASTVSFGYAADGEPQWHTTSVLMGGPKYPAGLKHDDHVNPDAHKGGARNPVTGGTYNRLNAYVVQGAPSGV